MTRNLATNWVIERFTPPTLILPQHVGGGDFGVDFSKFLDSLVLSPEFHRRIEGSLLLYQDKEGRKNGMIKEENSFKDRDPEISGFYKNEMIDIKVTIYYTIKFDNNAL
ncbi:MAG TPA: hypothetical protein VGA95_09210 [Thermodesulfobacteriota bacterium]